ncbi:MAG: DUF4838 domain-containing protein, partial [Kiritimatiellia bacterium]|nr:DUF4838 domain-containing protein [Lentisphaerota bacterium]
EDILKQKTIAFAPFTYRFHPQVRARAGLLPWTELTRGGPGGPGEPSSGYWMRAQRLQLCELPSPHGHGFPGDWWERFHETNPEYFALQPDGTRSFHGHKMCHSNPDLQEQWVADVERQLAENPNERLFNASPADGYFTGHCICENCRAWDNPDAEACVLNWQGLSHAYVSLSDRHITFANHVARKLKQRFPNRELYVYMLAYGTWLPAPVAVVPDDNVIIGNVANFLLRSDMASKTFTSQRSNKERFADWGKITKLNFWRPNVGAPVGFQWGMPDVPLQRTMDDMQFAASNGWMGIYVDFVREIWSTQGPLYYLMAQLTWNPFQDGQAILKDYYSRAFGPAAREMEAYWTYLEQIREQCYGTEQPGRADHDILEFYNAERLDKALELLDAAKKALGPDDELYRKRVAFVEAGLDFTRLITECGRSAREYSRDNAADDVKAQLRVQNHAAWDKLRALRDAQPDAVRWRLFFGGYKADGPPQTPRYAPPLYIP